MKTQLGEAEDDEVEPEQLQFKVVILGDHAVGKTSLALRFCEDHYSTQYKQTMALDFFLKRVVLPGDTHVCMNIWDIGGQSIGGKMVPNYIHGCHAVLFVYDITTYQSFQHLEDWMQLVRRTFTGKQMPYMALVANKQDLTHLRAVKVEKHNQFAEENDVFSYYVSARTGLQVHASFYRIAADLAGVALTKPEIEVAQKPLVAELINHPRNDPVHAEVHAERLGEKKKQCCSVM